MAEAVGATGRVVGVQDEGRAGGAPAREPAERRGPQQPARIEARWDGRRLFAPALVDAALPDAGIFVGCTFDEALDHLGRSSVAAPIAHRIAATAAFAAAGHDAASRNDAGADERAIAVETAQEHLTRLMLDWPLLFGHQPRRERFAEMYRRLARVRDLRAAYELGGDLLDLVAVELLGGFFRAAREPTALREFVDRARRGGTIGEALADLIEMGTSASERDAVPLLPALSAQEWVDELGGLPSPEFSRRPTLQGRPHETGALARHAGSLLVRILLTNGHRIAARLFARVIDLSDCASRLRHPLAADMPVLLDAAPLGERAGLAWVDTARGVVIHALRLDGERVAEYSIVGPTDWNFHPQGALAVEGGGWDAPSIDVARLRFTALVLSLDPGEGFGVVLKGADEA